MPIATYSQSISKELADEFSKSAPYGKVRMGTEHLFWKKAFSWKYLPYQEIRRIYRRVEAVDTKMCCGNVNFDIQKLVLELKSGEEQEVLIGEGIPSVAEQLFRDLKEARNEITYGLPVRQ
ncbi:MAG: hypothetical protein SOT28_00175 [Fusicatenibacter sp.]|nr:hypothetical protein [Lachnospiraceae bacterium]MDY2936720.1 hypothetical protein [Fusicatenibacter sp.]